MMFISVIALALFLVFFLTGKDNNQNVNINGEGNVINNSQTKKKSNFTTILNIGIFLIILSSVIFATSNWNVFKDNIKVLILGVETLLFLILGLILKYVFKVEKSGNALTFISSMLLPATFLCAGYFKLFGNDFSLFGKYSDIFLSVTFLAEALVLYLRKILIKSNKYFISLACFFIGIFLLSKGIINDWLLSFAITSIILLIVSLISKNIFKEKLEFDILNYVLIGILSFVYLYSTIYQLLSNNTFLLGKFSLILMLASLSINFIISLGKKNEVLSILSIIYESILVIWLVMFSGSLMTSAFSLVISGFVLYTVYYLSNNKYICTTSIIISYLQGLLGIILICFDKTYTLAAPIIAFSYIILTLISSLKKDNTIIINTIFEPIYLVMFAIGILVQPSIIKSIKPIDIIMVINACLVIALIVSTLLKNSIKNGYFIILAVGLFIQIICSSYTNVVYSIITLIINGILIAYAYFSKDSFYKKSTFWISLVFIINILIGLGKYHLITALLVLASLIIFMFITKNGKKRFTYASLLFIPIFQIISMTNIRLSLKDDLMMLVILPFIVLFSRKVINSKEETGMCVFELFFISVIGLDINNDIFKLFYLIVIYIMMYFMSKGYEKSSKVYLNYLLFFTPAMFFKLGSGKYEALYMICTFATLIINQILYRLIFEKRKTIFEIFHSVISLGLIVSLMGTLRFSNLISAILSIVLIIVLYLIYENERMRYVVLSFVIYPLSLLINYIPYGDVNNILNLFIWMIPLSLFLRKVFKVDNAASIAIESVTLSLMFLLFIFKVNIYVGITLGVISLISIILGLIFKYKSYNYVGYVALALTIIIQTISLWGSIPWWVYLLATGIILVVVAAIIESKKK